MKEYGKLGLSIQEYKVIGNIVLFTGDSTLHFAIRKELWFKNNFKKTKTPHQVGSLCTCKEWIYSLGSEFSTPFVPGILLLSSSLHLDYKYQKSHHGSF